MQAASCMASEPGCPCQLENPISFYEEGHLGFPQNRISLHVTSNPSCVEDPKRWGCSGQQGKPSHPQGAQLQHPHCSATLLSKNATRAHPRHCPHHLAGLSITRPSKPLKCFFRGSHVPQPRLPAINPQQRCQVNDAEQPGKSQACVNKATTPPDPCSGPKILSTDCWEASAHSLMETEQKGAVI